MEAFSHLLDGFAVALVPSRIFYCFVGCLWGTLVGILPGIGPLGGIALLLPGHFASERFGVERLSEFLAHEFPTLDIWPSRAERDPIGWIP